MTEGEDVDERDIARWRDQIERADPRPGTFNWPYALGAALDEVERLRAKVESLSQAAERAYTSGYVEGARQESANQRAERERAGSS